VAMVVVLIALLLWWRGRRSNTRASGE